MRSLLTVRFFMILNGTVFALAAAMFQPTISDYQTQPDNAPLNFPAANDRCVLAPSRPQFLSGLRRRVNREVRRRKVGRAYDMALEIARQIGRADDILDVGCGNGFIAHHLAALLGSYVMGIDVGGIPDAPINYRGYDGLHFPLPARSFELVLFCYVLHHAQDLDAIFTEVRRVLRDDGFVVIYEDVPAQWWDRIVCAIHNFKWRKRTGPCTFHTDSEWREIFAMAGFETLKNKRLSRWRKVVHPVRRQFFLLRPCSSNVANAN